jgi:uncharacterized protein
MNYQITRIQAKQFKVVVLIFAFYVLPPAAIILHLIPFSFRFLLLATVAPLLFFIRPLETISNKELGITRNNLNESIIAIIPITLVLALLTVVSAAVTERRYDNSGLSAFFYVFYVLISCSFQEFAYRGYLFPALDILSFGKWARIILVAVLYSFVHIIYIDVYILLSTLTAGLLWSIHYDRYRNLAGVTISHALLGVLTIGLGLI